MSQTATRYTWLKQIVSLKVSHSHALQSAKSIPGILGSLLALTVEDVDEAASGMPAFQPLWPSDEHTDAFADMWNNASDDMPSDSDSDILTSP